MTAMNADPTRVKIVVGQRDPNGKTRTFNPASDMPSLIEAAKKMQDGVELLILDPVVAAIPASKNSHNNAEARNGLQPIIDFAVAAKCAVIGITHFTKGTAGREPLERIVGSIAFGALARIVWIASKNASNTKDAPPRILVRAKSNIGPNDDGFGYDIEAAPLQMRPDITATRIVWLAPIEGTARELLAEAEANENESNDTKLSEAQRFLQKALGLSERPMNSLTVEAEAEGITLRTLRRAAKNIVMKRKDGHSGWLWKLRSSNQDQERP
jgi:putative DNA primase/helicase